MAMQRLFEAAVVVLLASPLALQAGDVTLGTCEGSVGAWEFTSPEGGRAVIARDGGKYRVLWVTTFVNERGVTEPEGIAADCTCQDAPQKLVWKCRVAYSLQAGLLGAEQTFEWAVDGGSLNSWYVAPDGKRTATGIRRAR